MLTETVWCLAATVGGWLVEYFTETSAGFGSVAALAALGCYFSAFLAGGWHTFQHAMDELRHGVLNIDLLMIAAAIGSAALGNWSDGGVLLFLFSLSHTLETIILGRTRRAIADLMNLTPDEAILLKGGEEQRVSVDVLLPGDFILVRPGERIPADGVIQSGRTSVDQSPMTGESIPVDKEPGAMVFSGTLNQQGVIEVRVTRKAGESTLARMVQLVEEAQSSRATTQQFTDWFGERYSWIVLLLALGTLIVSRWTVAEPWTASFYRSMTVLVVASPCAVVISIPAAILAAISSAARGGVLFKGGAALEECSRLKAMAFDKTGTLTLGRPQVVSVMPAEGISEAELFAAAAALEAHSEHPLAVAVVRAGKERNIALIDAEDVEAVTGQGIRGRWKGEDLLVGKLGWITADCPPTLAAATSAAQSRGETVVGVVRSHRWLGAIGISDTPRPTAREALNRLRELGIDRLCMLTGDAEPVARELAGKFGIQYQAGLLPEDKLAAIQKLRDSAGPTGMIGDGINDAPSLAAAAVGFSLGGAGTDVALETADVVILADDLRRLPYAIELARKTQHVIRQNLTFAFGVMGLLLIAAFVTPLPLPLAVVGHEGSTVLVILNGIRLLRFPRPKPWTAAA